MPRFIFYCFLYFYLFPTIMNKELYGKIANSTAHRPIRDSLSGIVLNNKSLFADLLHIALEVNDKNHHRACWVMELVCEAKIEWLDSHLEEFCNTLPLFKNESALRPISKICLFATEYDRKHRAFITPQQREQIMEACFDWLIRPEVKVATKAYSMRVLYLIGKKEDWIYPELIRILSEDTVKHSAGYKAAAKDILKKINN